MCQIKNCANKKGTLVTRGPSPTLLGIHLMLLASHTLKIHVKLARMAFSNIILLSPVGK